MSIQSPQRIAKSDRLQSSIYGRQVAEHRPPYIRPRRPETEPIERFSDEQFVFLVDNLLEDWDSPTLSEMGLCRAHSISLEELDAITDDPDFQHALALVRRIRAKRLEERQAAANAAVFDRLLRLVSQTSENTTATKEVRLACKQLTEFMAEHGDGHALGRSALRADSSSGGPALRPDPSPLDGAEGILPPVRAQPEACPPTQLPRATDFQPPKPEADSPPSHDARDATAGFPPPPSPASSGRGPG